MTTSEAATAKAAGVIESIAVRRFPIYVSAVPHDAYRVTWSGVDGSHFQHAAIPKSVNDVVIPDEMVMVTQIVDRAGTDAHVIGYVHVDITHEGKARARLNILGRDGLINIPIRDGLGG